MELNIVHAGTTGSAVVDSLDPIFDDLFVLFIGNNRYFVCLMTVNTVSGQIAQFASDTDTALRLSPQHYSFFFLMPQMLFIRLPMTAAFVILTVIMSILTLTKLVRAGTVSMTHTTQTL